MKEKGRMKPSGKKLRIILADDEEDFLKSASTALVRQGFLVSTAKDGTSVIQNIRSFSPDLVVLDLKMGSEDGLVILQTIRELRPELPVVILTGHGRIDDALMGMNLQITDFLQKPIDIKMLGKKINRYFEPGFNKPIREKALEELMLPAVCFPSCYFDQPVEEVLELLKKPFPVSAGVQVRPAIEVRGRDEQFVGLLGLGQVLQLMVPPFSHLSVFPVKRRDMFLAQSKLVGKTLVGDLVKNQITIKSDATLMVGVHLMVNDHLCQLAVINEQKFVGVLQEEVVFCELLESMLGVFPELD